MSQKNVYFIDGYSPKRGLLGVAAYLRELEDKDMEFTRFYMTSDGEWGQEEIWQDIVSVCYTSSADSWTWWLLGKRGHIFALSANDEIEETIPRAGTGPNKMGYLRRLKVIKDELYCCGMQRQVYTRRHGRWIALDDGIISNEIYYGFRDIDGTSIDDLHAVGRKGEIWYRDSGGWHQADSPTNQHLENIIYITSHLCIACGRSGTVLRGYQNQWTVLDNSNQSNLWGLAKYQEYVYLSGDDGLFIVRGDDIAPLDLNRRVHGYRLSANDQELWSIEEDEIWVYDGKRWKEIVCPDNE